MKPILQQLRSLTLDDLFGLVTCGVLAVMIGIAFYAFLGNPNAVVQFWAIGPYCHTIVIWGSFYILAYPRWKLYTPYYLLFVWAFQELTWNAIYVASKGALGLAYLQHGGNATGWGVIAVLGYVGYVVLTGGLKKGGKNVLDIDWKWLGVMAVFLLGYYALGVPIVNDWITHTITLGNWPWEVAYNIVAILIYWRIFPYNRTYDMMASTLEEARNETK